MNWMTSARNRVKKRHVYDVVAERGPPIASMTPVLSLSECHIQKPLNSQLSRDGARLLLLKINFYYITHSLYASICKEA